MRDILGMDVFEAVRTVLAVREYQGRPIPEDAIARVVEAGRLTASASNGQPWHFIVVTEPETLQRLGEAVPTGSYVAGAPMAIVVAVERDDRFAVSDASRAIQSMVLTAWDAGVGSNWTGFTGMDEVRSILDIPDDLDAIALIPFGYPAKERRAGRKNRRSLSEVASRERFGRPFS
jgi:nitroreductase